jgi:RNA-directed DNA polymerase
VSGDVHARFCEGPRGQFPRSTHLVLLVDAVPQQAWRLRAVENRRRAELANLGGEIHEETSRLGELAKGESVGFLGCDFRRLRARRGVWRPHDTPKLQKRTAVVPKLKEVFRRGPSHPVERRVKGIPPILRGWVNHFRRGYSGRCGDFLRQWVEKKIRRPVRRAKKRQGGGWQRGSLRGGTRTSGSLTTTCRVS